MPFDAGFQITLQLMSFCFTQTMRVFSKVINYACVVILITK